MQLIGDLCGLKAQIDQQKYTSNLYEWKKAALDIAPSQRSGAAEAVFGRKLYLFGGFSNGEAMDDFWEFDLFTKVFKQVECTGLKPSPRTSHSMVVDPSKGFIYVLCGSGSVFGHTNLNDVYRFNPFLNQWKLIQFDGTVVKPRYGQTAVFHENKIMMFGGTFGREFSNEFFEYNLSTMKVSEIHLHGHSPAPRYKHTATLCGNNMIVHGGASSNNYHLNDTYMVNLHSRVWTRLVCEGDIPVGQFAHSFCMDPTSKKGWLFGGSDRTNVFSYLYEFEVCYNDRCKWTLLRNDIKIPLPRYFHSSFYYHETGELSVFGGKASSDSQVRLNDLLSARVVPVADPNTPKCSISSDLVRFLQSGDMVDVQLNIVDNNGTSILYDLIYLHSSIVRARIPHISFEIQEGLPPMYSIPYTAIRGTQVACASLSQFVYYLYSDNVHLTTISREIYIPVVVSLMELAVKYNLGRLLQICKANIIHTISVVNARQLLGSKVLPKDPFMDYVKSYVKVHSGRLLDYPVSKDIIQLSITKVPPSLHHDLCRFRTAGEYCDFKIIMNGLDILAHHQILTARCKFFQSQCLRTWMKEAGTKSCMFLDIGQLALQLILDYIYYGELIVERIRLHPDLSLIIDQLNVLLTKDLGNYFGFSCSHFNDMCKNIITSTNPEKTVANKSMLTFRAISPIPVWHYNNLPMNES